MRDSEDGWSGPEFCENDTVSLEFTTPFPLGNKLTTGSVVGPPMAMYLKAKDCVPVSA
jgi:hypothetical protein